MEDSDDATVETLRATVADIVAWPAVDERVMFGCPSFTADGELFAVVSDQGVSLTRLPEDRRAELEAGTPVSPFDAGGRQVDGWATVRPEAIEPDALRPYLRASYETALAAED